jgi:hypothetical protein
MDGQRNAEQQLGRQAEEMVQAVGGADGEQRRQDRVRQRCADGREQGEQAGGGDQECVLHAHNIRTGAAGVNQNSDSCGPRGRKGLLPGFATWVCYKGLLPGFAKFAV